MARVTYAVTDDGDQNSSSSNVVVINAATAILGNSSVNKDLVALRFAGIALPSGTTIRHAYLKVYLSSITTSAANTYSLKGHDADNSAALTTTANDIGARTLTTQEVTSQVDDFADGYVFFDVTAIVQAIISRAGWASGNALTLIFNSPSASTLFTVNMTESGNPSELGIIYGDSADSERPPTVSGTGDYTNPNNAFTSNNVYATLSNSTSGKQIYESFGIPSLSGKAIDGILVKVEGLVGSGSSLAQFLVDLSWDGGTSWTSQKGSLKLGTSDRTMTIGGADTWSHSFVASEMTDANFKVRVWNSGASASEDYSIDYVAVIVYYRDTATLSPSRVYQANQAMQRAAFY